MDNIAHKNVAVNGINIHFAELGQGPLVLLLHGFPELWYSWRHQILFLAAHGYRAVAPDLRGYGDTTGAPTDDPTKFTVFHVVGDLIALLQSIAPEEDKVFVVGHDWGAIIAWHLCMFRPDKVKALVNLSVHFLPRDPNRDLVEIYRGMYGDDHYVVRFQEGDADDGDTTADVSRSVSSFLHLETPAVAPPDLEKRRGDACSSFPHIWIEKPTVASPDGETTPAMVPPSPVSQSSEKMEKK